MDLFLWGITSSYFRAISDNGSQFVVFIVCGILLWILTWRAQFEITNNVLAELWDKNLINIFVSPLSFAEWIISGLLMGILKGAISIIFASIAAYLMYNVNILQFGWYLVPFSILLIMAGWWIGLIIAAILMRYGTKVQTLAWALVWAVAPFSALYYPISYLPGWAQVVAYAIPTSYVFEAERQFLSTGTVNFTMLGISFLLNCLYLTIALFIIHQSFRKILKRGLISMY
jgi:ABC-2 type transport system permease protein